LINPGLFKAQLPMDGPAFLAYVKERLI